LKRLQYSLLAAAGVLILALVLTAVGPKRVMAALGYTPVRDVDNAARHAFAAQVKVSIGPNVQGGFESIVVPPNKRLVIETVTARGPMPGGQSAAFDLLVWTDGFPHEFFVPTRYVGTNMGGIQGDHYYGSEAVRIYADGGSEVRAVFTRSGFTGSASADISISGHLVDLP
jgi:hypothetical protein